MPLKVAYISPIQYLSLIPEEADFHLLLAHLLPNERYCEFYREKQKRGDFIIIDNSAFELPQPLKLKEYSKLIENSGITPKIIVAPDFLFKPWEETYSASFEFIINYGDYFDSSKTKIMVVPQSIRGDIEGWIKCHDLLTEMNNVEFCGLAIKTMANALCHITGTKDISVNRIFSLIYLKDKLKDNIKYHALGWSSPREIIFMDIFDEIYSTDSSSIFWHGINNIRYDDSPSGLKEGKINKPVDFFIDYDENRIEDIQYNLQWIKNLLK